MLSSVNMQIRGTTEKAPIQKENITLVIHYHNTSYNKYFYII